MFGLVLMAGSGGDCDGKCMEYANSCLLYTSDAADE